MTKKSAHDDTEQIEVQAGRRAPFTMNPDWVLLSGVSRDALAVYWALNAHVNEARGNGRVWPTQDQLGRLVDYSTRKGVRRATDELVAINAIETESVRTHGGMRSRTVYTLHQTPPPGWDRPASLGEWYRQLKAEEDASSQVEPDVSLRTHRDVPVGTPPDVSPRTPSDVPVGTPEEESPEPEVVEEEFVRSSAREAREQGAPAGTGRTDGGGSAKKKNRKIRGVDPAAPVAIEGEHVAITEEHQFIAEQLATELGLTGSTATDPDLSAQVVDDVGMWAQQRRDLRQLLPRAVAAADGNTDAVRGWLFSKGTAAERATFILDAFSDEHIGDVHHCPEVEHIDVRRHRQEAAQRAAQEREQRLNARAERETPDPDPWTPHSGSQRPSTEGGDADAPADPAQDLAAAVDLPFELTRMERTQLTVAIDDFGYETIACAVKTLLTEGTADQLRQVVRTGLLRSQLQEGGAA